MNRASTAPAPRTLQAKRSNQAQNERPTKTARRHKYVSAVGVTQSADDRRMKLIGTASCGKPDSSTFAVDVVDLRTPSPDTTNPTAIPTPPSSGGKGKAVAPTWNTDNSKESGGKSGRQIGHQHAQLATHKRFGSADEIDEIVSMCSDNEPARLLKGNQRKKPKKRKRSNREKTHEPGTKKPSLLSETPSMATPVTPPPTPPSVKPTRKDKGKGAMRPSSSPSGTVADSEVTQPLATGFDSFLQFGLGSEMGSDDDLPPKRNKHKKEKSLRVDADVFIEQVFRDRVPQKQRKTATPDPGASQYAARVEDMSSEDEKTQQRLKPNSTHILETRTPTPTPQHPRARFLTATGVSQPEAPKSAPLEEEPGVEKEPEAQPQTTISEKAPQTNVKSHTDEELVDSAAPDTVVVAQNAEDVHSIDRETMTEQRAAQIEAAAQTAAEQPADTKPTDIKPALSESGNLMALLPVLMALQQTQANNIGQRGQHGQHGAHDCALECELCRTLATLLHGLHRGGLLGSCCSHK